jgi:hypothetical protein
MIGGAKASPRVPLSLAAGEPHAQLRLRSLSWAVLAAAAAAGLALLPLLGHGLEAALRAAGCGFFYGLLAFHLQRVDPDDGHLQAGLVGAICGIRSLGAAGLAPGSPVTEDLPAAMMGLLQGWWPLWLPVIGSALALQGVQRLLPAPLPAHLPEQPADRPAAPTPRHGPTPTP